MSEEQPKADVVDNTSDQPVPENNKPTAVRNGTIMVLVIIVLSLVWYILSDRFTPYTTQARVQGYVIGVAPKVAGVVTKIWIDNNRRVEEGQPLLQIDPAQYQIALDKAQSDLENARRQVGAGGAAVEAAEANLKAALANEKKAEQDLKRLQRLHKEDPGTVSVRRLEVSQATLDQARAKVTAARADIRRAIEQKGGQDDSDNSIINVAISAVEKAELDLANTIVKAPSRGIVTDLQADVGRFAGTGNPVLTFIAIHDLWINADFTENNLGHLHPGSQVEILFDALPGKVIQGQVRSIGVGVSAGQTQSPGTLPTIQNSREWLRQPQRFPVVIGFKTEGLDELSRQLRIGGQASVIAYSKDHGVLNMLGKVFIRAMSLFSYAY